MEEKVPDDKKMKYCSEARIRTHHAVRSIIPPEFQHTPASAAQREGKEK